MSSTKYSSLSLVILTEISTIGLGLIVQFTVLLLPLGPMTVRLLVKLPIAFTLTLIVIVAFLVEILVNFQVTF